MASAPTVNVAVGDRLLVYFDSRDPTMNSLEDFFELSRRDQGFVYFLVAGIVTFVGIVAFCKVAFRSPEGRSAPK